MSSLCVEEFHLCTLYSYRLTSSSQIQSFHVSDFSSFIIDYQKNAKYNSNKQAVPALTTPHHRQHRNSFSPNILHALEFFAHPHRWGSSGFTEQRNLKKIYLGIRNTSNFLAERRNSPSLPDADFCRK